MTVHALYEYGLTVYEQQTIFNLRGAETYALGISLIVGCNHNFVEVGSLGRPLGGSLHLKCV